MQVAVQHRDRDRWLDRTTNIGPAGAKDIGIASLGNVAFATAGSSSDAEGIFNLASSLGGTRSELQAQGIGNSVLNLGSDNKLGAQGVINNATNSFGDGNVVRSSNAPGTGLARFLPGLNVAFNIGGDDNEVKAGAVAGGGNGPLAIAGANFVNAQNDLNEVRNNNFGIELRTPFNVSSPAPTTLNKTGTSSVSKSGTTSKQRLSASVKKTKANIKSVRDNVRKAVSGLSKKADKPKD